MALAMPSLVRAAPAQVNITYSLSTSPFMITKGEGWIEQAVGTKVNWIEVGSGAEINTMREQVLSHIWHSPE